MRFAAEANGQAFEIEVDNDGLVRMNGQPAYVRMQQLDGMPVFSLVVEGAGSHTLYVEGGPRTYQIEIAGSTFPVKVRLARPQLGTAGSPCNREPVGQAEVRAPLAGRLLELPSPAGKHVETGQVVARIESMKMRLELRAPQAGVVRATYGPLGREVGQGEVLVLIFCELDRHA